MKKVFRYSLLALVVLLIVAGFYIYPRLAIVNGYASKMMCSCVFVANRDAQTVIDNDLNYSLISLASPKVNMENQSVTSSVWGLNSRTAYYNPVTGCALTDKKTAKEYQNIYFNTQNIYKNVDSLNWPYSSRIAIADSIKKEINWDKLKQAVQHHFNEDKLEEGIKKNTRAVVVIYKDQLIYEQYAEGFNETTRQLGWSMSKSLTNAMFGVLVKKGLIDINNPTGITEWQKDDRKKITWNNLLQMSDGLDWLEDYTTISDATRMLYKKNDMYGYAIQTELGSHPGSKWYYSSGTSNILAGAVKDIVGEDNYLAFPYDEIFSKIGANSFLMETDASGKFVGSSYSWATPRDWAKFGLLYLHDGNWLGEQILPKGWAKYSGTPIPNSEGKYGAHFWTANPEQYPDVPTDMYRAAGYHGQWVFIIPSRDLVVVRMGLTENKDFRGNQFLKELLEAIGTN